MDVANLRGVLSLDSIQFERGVIRAQGATRDLNKDLNRVTGAAAAMGVAMSLTGAMSMVDQITATRNALISVTGSVEAAADQLESLSDIAARTRSPLQGTAELFQRVSSAANELGASEAQILRFTENVGLALGATGQGGAAATGALQQLSQAMAGGTVRAEEFNSILEGAYPLALAAAKGIDEAGGSVGRLRQLVVEGEISSQEFFGAIISQTEELEATFARTAPTISQSFQVLNDSVAMFLGGMDQATGVSSAIAQSILFVADNVDRLAAYALAAGGIWAGAYAGGVIKAAIATGTLSGALVTLRGALLRTGIGAAAVAVGELLYRFSDLTRATGGVGNAFSLLKDVALEVFDRIGIGVGAIVPYMQSAAAGFRAEFLYALADMTGSFSQFVGNIANGLNDLFGLNLSTAPLDTITADLNRAGTDAVLYAQSMEGAAASAVAAATAPLQSLQALRDSTAATAAEMEAGAGAAADFAGALGGGGAGGGGGGSGASGGVAGAAEAAAKSTEAVGAAVDAIQASMSAAEREAVAFKLALHDAGMEAEELGEAKAQIVVGGIESMSDALGDWVARGFKDFGDLWDAGIEGFRSMLSQMVSLAARNRIMLSPGMGGAAAGPAMAGVPGMGGGGGILGSMGGALGGFGSAFGAGISGFATNLFGLNGAAGGIGSALGFAGSALSGATAGIGGFATALGAIALPVAAVIGVFAAFRKKTTELDAGLRVTVDGIDAVVESFAKTRSTRLFGLIRNTSTDFDPASAEVANPISSAYAEIYRSTRSMVETLGLGADALKSFSYTFDLSLKGLTDEQRQAAIAEEFDKIANALAKTAGVTGDLIRKGETTAQALQRLVVNFGAANQAMDFLDSSLFKTGRTGIGAADAFVSAFGSVEAMAQGVQTYFQGFYTVPEQMAEARETFRQAFHDMFPTRDLPRTKEAFKSVVDSLMAAGRTETAGKLIALSDEFLTLLGLQEQVAQGQVDGVVDAIANPKLAGLQRELWTLLGRTDLLQKQELEGLTAVERAMQIRIWGLEKEEDALDAQRAASEDARRAMEALNPADFATRLGFQRAQSTAFQQALSPKVSEDTKQLVAEMKGLKEEQGKLREQNRQLLTQIATNTRRTENLLEEQKVDRQEAAKVGT